MTYNQIVTVLTEATGLQKKDVKNVLTEFQKLVLQEIKSGEKIRIPMIGVLEPKVCQGRKVVLQKKQYSFDTFNTIKLKVGKKAKTYLNTK